MMICTYVCIILEIPLPVQVGLDPVTKFYASIISLVMILPLWSITNADEEREIWNSGTESDGQTDSEEGPESQPLEDADNKKERALGTWLSIIILSLHFKYHLTERLTNKLFQLLHIFLTVVGRFSSFCATIASSLPQNLHQAYKSSDIGKERFKRFVVSRKCHQVYYLRECIELMGTIRQSKLCSYKGLEKHTCDTILLKTVELSTGKTVFIPHLSYCYIDLKTSLQFLLKSSSFIENCEYWKKRTSVNGVLSSIYDGQIWNDFKQYEGVPFLSEPYSYALILNLDWFQPYKHLTYSIGVLYLSVLNLPSHVRYSNAYTILVGVLPGPHEPKLTVNTYLEPLVNDLLEVWRGVSLYVNGHGETNVRCALLCVACDSPAGRKACGFLGHSANLGCTKCMKVFPGSVGFKKYSGFEKNQWVPRTNETHRANALSLLHCRTKTELKTKESSCGCRYSVLLRLPLYACFQLILCIPYF